jgi:transglutaminase-like putative cysteine protease
MRIQIDHITKYEFSTPARQLLQILRLTPSSNYSQNVVNWDINFDANGRLTPFKDAYGNQCHVLSIDSQIRNLTIETIGAIDTKSNDGVQKNVIETLPPSVYCRFSPLATPDAAIMDFANKHLAQKERLNGLHDLMNALYNEIEFSTESTTTITDAKAAFANKSGVCQDQAHIFIAACRAMNIPSRYVSGHLLRQDGNEYQEAAHAWAESYVENLGWVAFDPVNGICANEAYIRVAIGLDYRDAAPVSGSRMGGGVETMSVGLHVRQSQGQIQSQS